MVDGAATCSCPDGFVGDRCQDCDISKNLVACGINGNCVKISDVCSKQVTCSLTPQQITKYCGGEYPMSSVNSALRRPL
ncbi:hypothetical protein OS493_007207 [Desmophyllum pertusum]|uniref:EGF-like domain-containing protein n=1 Tax=Desmophyllum pertusum TaxID=174260 RepID=A0A9X0CZ20_9CNID|nr:hypothetical protein OS493_007207 [Desmophyllum pertusum]